MTSLGKNINVMQEIFGMYCKYALLQRPTTYCLSENHDRIRRCVNQVKNLRKKKYSNIIKPFFLHIYIMLFTSILHISDMNVTKRYKYYINVSRHAYQTLNIFTKLNRCMKSYCDNLRWLQVNVFFNSSEILIVFLRRQCLKSLEVKTCHYFLFLDFHI